MSQEEQFHQLILQNSSLQERLKQSTDSDRFVQILVQMAAEHGYSFTPSEVRAYITRNFFALMRQFS